MRGGWQVFLAAAGAAIIIAVVAGVVFDNLNTRVDEVPAVSSVRLQ